MSEFFRASGGGGGISPFKAPAINYVDCTAAPPSEVEGDRYILDDTAGTVNAGWDGASKLDLVTFTGGVWVAETPEEGWFIYLTTPNYYMLFTDGAWVEFVNGTTAVVAHELSYDHALLHDAATAGDGIDVTGQVISNTDKGTDAVGTHESTYNHGDLVASMHEAATGGTGIMVTGQQIDNTDTGSAWVGAHELNFDHSLLHAKSHALNSATDHSGTLNATQMAVSGNWTIAASSTLSLLAGNASSVFSVSCPIVMPTVVANSVVTVQNLGLGFMLYPVVNLPVAQMPVSGTWTLTGGLTVTGAVVGFGSFPTTPFSAPTTDYQAANKKYVDDSVSGRWNAAVVDAASGKTALADADKIPLIDSEDSDTLKTFTYADLLALLDLRYMPYS